MINVSIDPQDMKKAVRGLINQLASKIDKDYMQAAGQEIQPYRSAEPIPSFQPTIEKSSPGLNPFSRSTSKTPSSKKKSRVNAPPIFSL